MKTDILYTLGLGYGFYRDKEAEIARSGKTITMGTLSARVATYHWGAATPELRAEAQAIKDAQKALDERHRTLCARLKETQPALLAAAKVAPMTPKPKPTRIDSLAL